MLSEESFQKDSFELYCFHPPPRLQEMLFLRLEQQALRVSDTLLKVLKVASLPGYEQPWR